MINNDKISYQESSKTTEECFMLSLLIFIACGEEVVIDKDPEEGEVLLDADGDARNRLRDALIHA